MPIKVNPSETHDEFIGRCMSKEQSSFPDEEQRYAVCESYWRESKMSSQERMINKMNKKQQELEGACWPNYIQIGMKPGKDGKPVPRCVGPIKD